MYKTSIHNSIHHLPFVIAAGLFVSLFMSTAQAGIITSAYGTDANGNSYGYSFEIVDGAVAMDNIFNATLTNMSSTATNPSALIDKFAFNLTGTPVIGTDVFFSDFVPSTWGVSNPNGNGVRFDFVGDEQSNQNRLSAGQSLTFNIRFSDLYNPLKTLLVFEDSDSSRAQGFGGGGETGQVAVHIQQLANGDSDTLVSDWGDNPPQPGFNPVPEPGSLAIWCLGLIGSGGLFRRRRLAA